MGFASFFLVWFLKRYWRESNDFCIKTGSGESHFNFSLTIMDKVTSHCPQITILEENGEPKQNQPWVLLLASLKSYS